MELCTQYPARRSVAWYLNARGVEMKRYFPSGFRGVLPAHWLLTEAFHVLSHLADKDWHVAMGG